MKRQKYERSSFDLSECKATIQVIPSGKQDPGYGTVFLNIQLPDGRWVPFKQVEGSRVPIYKEREEAKT
jgi:hypothetical protein